MHELNGKFLCIIDVILLLILIIILHIATGFCITFAPNGVNKRVWVTSLRAQAVVLVTLVPFTRRLIGTTGHMTDAKAGVRAIPSRVKGSPNFV